MAQLKNTSIDSTSDLSLPSGTTAQRPATPLQGMIRYNTTLNTTEYYDGIAWRPISDTGVEATGGTIIDTEIGGVAYRIHEFRNTGNSTFTVTKGGEVEYLIVAGGGGGGSKSKGSSGGTAGGAGGGAGGFLTGFFTVTPQSYTITVGAGGQGGGFPSGGGSTQAGGDGGSSSAFGLTAIGGGGGAPNSAGAGRAGGSGGGAASFNIGGNGTAGQGNKGGDFVGSSDTSSYPRAGGGGAGQPGGNAINGVSAGNGGNGLISSITGTVQWYAGGGGGSWRNGSSIAGAARGGIGGGQNGGIQSGSTIVDGFYGDDLPMPSGLPNSGGGGGGQGGSGVNLLGHGGFGGSGIVVARYRRNASTTTNPNSVLSSLLPYNYTRDVRPVIAREGLVLELDVANPLSYPGTGTTVTDLSGNSTNGTLVNSPAYNNFGFFTFFADDRYIDYGDSATLNNTLNGTTNWSICYLVNPRTDGRILDRGGIGADPTSSLELNVTSITSNNLSGSSSLGIDVINQGWCYIGITRNSLGNYRWYLNGELVRTETYTQFYSGSGIWKTGRRAANLSSALNGDLAQLLIYNRVLGGAEVRQNFNAVRGRYGI